MANVGIDEATPSAPVARSMAKGFASLFSSRVLATGLQIVSFALLANHLGPAGLGIYTTAISFVSLFKMATSFGFRGVVLREVAQRPERESELVPNLVYLRAGLGAMAYVVLAIVVVVAGYEPQNRDAALIAGLYLVLLAFESFYIPLEVRLRMGWAAVADVVEAVVLVVGIFLLGRAGVGINGFLWLYVAANACNLVIVSVAALRMSVLRWRPSPARWRELLAPAAQLGLAELLIGLYFRLDLLVLARFKPEDDVGQYGAAVRFLVTFNLLQVLVMTVLGPVLARSVVEGTDVLERRYARAVNLMCVIGFPVAVGGAMTAWRVVPALPGFSEFSGAGVALSILAPGVALMFVGSITSNVLVNAHLQRRFLAIAALGLVSVIVLNALLIPGYSYIGAAITTTVTEALVVGASILTVRKRLGISPDYRRFGRILLACAVMAAVLLPGYLVHPLLQAAVGAAAYAAVVLPLGALRRDDLDGIRRQEAPA